MLKIIENGKETGYIQVFQWHKTSVQRPTRFDFYKCGLGAVVIDLAFAPSDCFENDIIFAKKRGNDRFIWPSHEYLSNDEIDDVFSNEGVFYTNYVERGSNLHQIMIFEKDDEPSYWTDINAFCPPEFLMTEGTSPIHIIE